MPKINVSVEYVTTKIYLKNETSIRDPPTNLENINPLIRSPFSTSPVIKADEREL